MCANFFGAAGDSQWQNRNFEVAGEGFDNFHVSLQGSLRNPSYLHSVNKVFRRGFSPVPLRYVSVACRDPASL